MVMFYESYYLANNADVAKAVKAGYFNSGWEHYVAHGWLENRSFTAPAGYGAFNENYYLANNPDVAFAVQEGYFATGWQHYVIHGQAEGRSSAMPAGYNDFNETYYLTNNPDVAEAVEDGIFLSGWHHYSWTGRLEGRTYAQPVGYGNFSEYYYLINNPDVAAAVDADYFTSGWQHYVVHGQSEGRSFAAPTFTIGATTIQNGGEMPTLAPIVTPNLYTLQDVYVAGTEGTPPVKEVYWGYTPCLDCDTDNIEGIPVSELLAFVATITGLDLTELGLIDDDGVGPFDNVTNLSLSLGSITNKVEAENDDGSGEIGAESMLTITFADGTSVNAEAYLGENYMQFLRDLIFYEDENGILHSRLFEKVVDEGTSGTSGYYEPLVLTPTQNNGSTVENPFYHLTTSGDDRIVAGRLELLHGAYIDGGGGNNILEIDAKGVYAQPLALVNIQHILIENLPNIYTYVDGSGTWIDVGDEYPLWNDQDLGIYSNSIIDISRAVDIETLTITEGRFDGFQYNNSPGSLTVAGIRNGVTTTLDGGFSQNVYLHYSAVSDDDGVKIELHNMNMAEGAQLIVAHNADTLNIDSTGGGNRIYNADLGGLLSKMVITGNAHLYIDNDLDPSFHDASPVIIDASANTGGVTLTLSGSQNVTFLGSTADDNFVVSTADTEVMAENDETVTIIDTAGNNRYEVVSYSVSITDGNGNNNYEVDAHDATVVAGNGNNHFEVSTTELANLTAGNGNNHFEVSTSKLASLTAGDGDNHFEVTAESLTLTAGNGDNVVESKGGESAAIVLGSGDNSINTDGKDSVNIAVGGGDNSISSIGSAAVAVVTGNGDNTIIASAESLDIATGTGNDVVTIAGTANSSEEIGNGPDGRTGLNLMLILDDSGSMSGPEIESLKAAANSLFDNIEEQNMEAVAITVVFGTNASASPWGSIDDARTLIDALQGTSGGTDYVAALNVAMEGFAQTGAISGGVNVSIFISDGFPNEPISTSLQSTWEGFLIQNDMVSHALGIGALNDLEPLRPIAYNGYTGQGLDPIIGSLDEGILEDLVGEAVVSVSGKDALVNIDLGSGQNTLILGDSDELSQGLIAVEGSSITGESIKLIVNTVSDLRAAELQGITKVVLDNDDIGTSNRTVENGLLTLTAEQFTAIGAANFSVEGSIFHTYSQVKIIVTESTSLTALGVDSLSRNIDLLLELEDGVTLAMTAEQLHTKVAPNGITLADDGTTDVVSGKVVITGGGVNFDPFNTSDTVRTIIDGREYVGGSLSTDFMVDGEWYNVTVESGTSYDPQGNEIPGYDRPADAPALVVFKINTGTGANTVNDDGVDTWHTGLEIVGERDINFTGPIQLGEVNNVSTNAFTIDFSELEGNVTNMVIDHFEQLGQGGGIHGNADKGYTAEVLINLAADEGITGTAAAGATNSIGFDETDAQGLVSSGVSKYVVTVIDGPTASANLGNQATIKLCDTTQDLEVLALRGNFNDTLKVVDAAWGLAFELQGGSTLKADGPTGTANVGKLLANYQWDGADAVVSLTHSVVGDTRTIKAYGITINNANSISIDVAGSAMIESVAGNSVEVLDVDATGNVTFVADLPDALEAIDAAGVLGTFAASFDPNDDFTFVGSAGGSTLTLTGSDFEATDDTSIDGGVGGLTLVIAEDFEIDLEDATLANISSVVLEDDSVLWLTIPQAAQIGAGNFILDGDSATLNLSNLDDSLFVRPAFDADIDVAVVSVAPLPTVTLNAGTNLTGIGGLAVHEGTTLSLTLAQFQQLNGTGTIQELVAGETDFTINITGITQADIDNLNAYDGFDGLSFAGVEAAATLNLILAESVDLSDANLAGVDSITFGDDMKLTLGDITQADGVIIVGGANSTLEFTDTTGFLVTIDASGFDVDVLRITNLLVSGNNVDYMFAGLPASVTKVIYNGIGDVDGKLQNVIVEPGTTIFNDISFNEYQLDTEVTHLTMNLQGGTELDGDLVLSTVDVNGATVELVPYYLQQLVINSNGTAANRISGSTANIITGDITPAAYAPAIGVGSRDNNLKTVIINAEQAFVLEGQILFSSHGSDNAAPLNNTPTDGITANDDDAAIATLTVTGSADVTLGGINTSDDDIDGLNVIYTGTGTLAITVDAADIDQAATNNDALSFTGTGSIELTTVGAVNLSDDVLTAVDSIDVVETGALTLSYTQFVALGAANINVIDGPDANTVIGNASLYINGYTGGAFSALALDTHFNVVEITLADQDVTLDAGVDLTNVSKIWVQEGRTLTMTAAQFQQLKDNGAIEGVDTDGDAVFEPFNLVITGLTQADIDRDLDSDGYLDADDGFSLADVDTNGGTITITLGGDVVMANMVAGVVTAGSVANLADARIVMSAGQTLGLVTHGQADDRVINGAANTTVNFLFDINFGANGEIEAGGYSNITTLRALATSVDGEDVELVIDNLANNITLNLYEDPLEVGYVSNIHRVVIIEPGVQVPGFVAFNGQDGDREVRTLRITFQGDGTDPITDPNGDIEGAVIQGNLVLDAFTPGAGLLADKFGTLYLVSEGTGDSNGITGNITPMDQDAGDSRIDNNLLNIEIDAASEFTIGGTIIFNSTNAALNTATLLVEGTAPVNIGALNVTDVDIDVLDIENVGGTLTITGLSPSILAADTEEIIFRGTGDIVLGTVETPEDYADGIDGGGDLSLIDASGLTGDLSIENITAIDEANFSFISGTGVTTLRVSDSTLNDDDAPSTEPGWSFDLSNAAPGSVLTFGTGLVWTDGDLNIDLGTGAVLYLTEDTDWTNLDNVNITGTIVLGAGVDLTLTAAMADDLTIVWDPAVIMDDSDPDFDALDVPTVTITELSTAAYDFSGIMAGGQDNIDPATVLVANAYLLAGANNVADVTINALTDLGDVAISLLDVANGVAGNDDLAGQTIRFNTIPQAERIIVVDGAVNGAKSTNVVWLFQNITAPVETKDYDGDIGRLWVTEELITNEGGDVEQLFTTLPNSILRVDFTSVTALDILLLSGAVDRIVEFVHFTTLGTLTFSDVGLVPIEHVESLTLNLGGEVTLGNITLNDNALLPTVDPASIDFTELTINSKRALHSDALLASEFFNNNNNGVDEAGEHVQPNAINTIGNIGVGAYLDLLVVNINTFLDVDPDVVAGQGLQPNAGAALQMGILTYGARTPATPTVQTAELNVTGDNDVNILQVVVTDTDITGPVTVDTTGFTATLTAPGASPGILLGAHIESLVFTNGSVEDAPAQITITADGVDNNNETMTVNYTLDGVAASVVVDLNAIDVTNATLVAAAVRDALNDIEGITATSALGVVSAVGTGSHELVFEAGAVGGTTTTLAYALTTASEVPAGTITLGTSTNAGIYGAGLSTLNAAQYGGTLNLGILALIDGTNDDSTPLTPANDGLVRAFNMTAGTGVTTATLGKDPDSAAVPTLAAGSEWRFDYTSAAAGSRLTITDEVVFQAPVLPATDLPILTLINVDLYIDGDVDLTGVDLAIDANSDIFVQAGNTLTLTLDQIAALPGGVAIMGEGTVYLTGEVDTDAFVALNLAAIQTVGVDLSLLTNVGIIVPQANLVGVTLNLNGAVDDDGEATGYNFVGSDFNDSVRGSVEDDTLTGGAGDDVYSFNEGDDTFIADAGNDFTELLNDNPLTPDQDVVIVRAGASFDGELFFDTTLPVNSFIATAETSNAGTGTIRADAASLSTLIDMSLATGPNGWTIVGSTDNATDTDVLIGSAFADIINGGNMNQSAAAAKDILTGNGGGDVFQFDVDMGNTTTLTPVTTQANIDEELITITSNDSDGTMGTITVNYTINGNAQVLAVDLSTTANTAIAIAAAIAGALQTSGVFIASASTGGTNVITAVAAGGRNLEFQPITLPGNTDFTYTITEGTDVAQVVEITATGSPTVGDTYSVDAAINTGGNIIGTYVAVLGDDQDDVANGLEANFTDGAVVATDTANVLTLTDANPDNGGFTVGLDTTAAFGGSGASNGTDYTTADVITDFVSGLDNIQFRTSSGTDMQNGSGANYLEAATVADAATALANATTAFATNAGILQYYLTAATDLNGTPGTGLIEGQEGAGLLYFDANLDGTADGVIVLLGVTQANFAAFDIIAA